VAAHLEPDILVVDEVLAVGDAEFQKKAIGKMQDISKGEGRTVLFVSHNMAAVKSLCTNGMVLQHGFRTFSGSSIDAVDFYLKEEGKGKEVILADRTDRLGNGKLRFKKISFLDNNDNSISELISGESVKICIDYELIPNYIPSEVILSLIFRDNSQNIITSFISEEAKNEINIIKPNGQIILEIENLNLRGEVYEIMILAFEGNTNLSNALDIVENAISINILQGDILQVGNINRKGHSSIFPFNYTIK
jgi:lipopolysaccharide transport system ATP-binding protein